MKNRVEWDDDGLDEIVTDGGAHLERMSKNSLFLQCHRRDGSALAIWIKGKITSTEERESPSCGSCGSSIQLDAPPDGHYLQCPACGWSARKALGGMVDLAN